MRSNSTATMALVLLLSVVPVAGEGQENRPPPLPAIELPPKPAPPEGTPLVGEAREKLQEGDTPAALALLQQAYERGVNDVRTTYNAACAAAAAGRVDDAFVWLERAADAGYRDAGELARDADLELLRRDTRFASVRGRVLVNAARFDEENNAELRAMYEADQSSRGSIPTAEEERKDFWKKLTAEDESRRRRVEEILASGDAKTGADYYAAAMVYQHGSTLQDYENARRYAAKAVELGDEKGRWLAAAAWDRWLRKAGYPQRFGTQYMCDPKCRLEEWDPEVTDEERARWDVPPIEESIRRAEDF